MNIKKSKYLQNWGLMRSIRLVLACVVFVEAWRSNEMIIGFLGIVLLAQSVFNVGCCGSSGCDIGHVNTKHTSSEKSIEEVTFTEVTKS